MPYVSWLERAATERALAKGTARTLATYVRSRIGEEAARRFVAMAEGMSEAALEQLTQTIFAADEAGLRALLFPPAGDSAAT